MSSVIIQTLSDQEIGRVLLAVLVLLIAALVCGNLAMYLKVPKVAGELFGGIIVGPSVLGAVLPGIYEQLFYSNQELGVPLSVFYWLGLIYMMFSTGYETDFEGIKKDSKIVLALLAGSTLLPMALGLWIGDAYFSRYYLGIVGNALAFQVVFAIAVAITSLPVISKIFMDIGIIDHRFARIVLTTSTIQDLLLWILLSVVTSMVTTDRVGGADLFLHVFFTLLLFVFALVLMPRIRSRFPAIRLFSYDSIYIIVCLAIICIGLLVNIDIMYSAFVAGIIFKSFNRSKADQSFHKYKEISLAFFVPVYFAVIGLQVNVTGAFSISRFLLYFLFAFGVELLGCVISMKLIRMGWIESFNLGIAMNARGGPGIVLATATYGLGIINYEFFCVMIFTVLITSAFSGWWIELVHRKGMLLQAD